MRKGRQYRRNLAKYLRPPLQLTDTLQSLLWEYVHSGFVVYRSVFTLSRNWQWPQCLCYAVVVVIFSSLYPVANNVWIPVWKNNIKRSRGEKPGDITRQCTNLHILILNKYIVSKKRKSKCSAVYKKKKQINKNISTVHIFKFSL